MDGAHTHGHGIGGGLGPVAAIGGTAVLAVVLTPVLVALIHALVVIVLVATGAAAVSGAALIAWRVRRGPSLPPWQPGVLRQPQRAPLGQPRQIHVHLHGITEDQAAELARQLQAPPGRPGGAGTRP